MDQVVSEYCGATLLERYLDTGAQFPDFTANPSTDSVEDYYEFRIISTKRFVPCRPVEELILVNGVAPALHPRDTIHPRMKSGCVWGGGQSVVAPLSPPGPLSPLGS